MKKIQLIQKIVFSLLFITTFSCVNDDEITLAPYPRTKIFSEDFQTAVNNTNLDLPGWTNFAQAGTRLWREKTFSGNGYAEFSAFNNGEASNIVWLVTPKITTTGYDQYLFTFDTAKAFLDVDSPDNTITAFYSTNFTGNVAAATWTAIQPLNIPKKSADNYTFSTTRYKFPMSGDIHFAFKYVGNGLPNSTLDGLFQIDNVAVYGLR